MLKYMIGGFACYTIGAAFGGLGYVPAAVTFNVVAAVFAIIACAKGVRA